MGTPDVFRDRTDLRDEGLDVGADRQSDEGLVKSHGYSSRATAQCISIRQALYWSDLERDGREMRFVRCPTERGSLTKWLRRSGTSST